MHAETPVPPAGSRIHLPHGGRRLRPVQLADVLGRLQIEIAESPAPGVRADATPAGGRGAGHSFDYWVSGVVHLSVIGPRAEYGNAWPFLPGSGTDSPYDCVMT